jgi:ERCC4-related helicase
MSDPTGETIEPATDTSSKLQSLVYLLKKAHSDTPIEQKFCGIVFAKRRLVATLVNLALMRMPGLEGVIKSASLVGHGQKKGTPDLAGYEGMTFREQCEIIGRFRLFITCLCVNHSLVYRKHELNLLISTSLLEEGLGILFFF